MTLYATPPLDELRRLAQCGDAAALEQLIPLASLFDCEIAFLAEGTDSLPYIDSALAPQVGPGTVTLNFGALQCLTQCLERLAPDGFILLNDYGPVKEDAAADYTTAQRFGITTAVGLNPCRCGRHVVQQLIATKHCGSDVDFRGSHHCGRFQSPRRPVGRVDDV